MKKTVSLVLAFVLLATLLAGCGTKTPDSSADEKPKVVILANAGWGDDAYANVIATNWKRQASLPASACSPTMQAGALRWMQVTSIWPSPIG